MTGIRARTALAFDIVSVLAFVAIGRRSHDETGNIFVGLVEVAAPFLIGLGVGWLVSRAWTEPAATATGVAVWLSTVVVGLLLRRFAFDRGIASAFIIVATATLGLLLVGWRLVATRRR